ADSWEQLNNTLHAQGAGNALTWSEYDGCLYAFVGNSKRGTEFIRYNPSTDTWENLTFNPSWTATDDGASLVTIGDDVYALKGEVDDTIPNGDFAKYDIPTDTWIDLPDIPEVEGVGDGASLLYIDNWSGYNDTIFALGGGEADKDPGYNFYSYSLSQNQWDELEDIPCPIGYYVGNRLGFVDGRIYYWQGTPSTWECNGTAFWMYEMSLPSTLKVHNINTGEDFATIQAAIDDPDTQEGDIIEVEDGTFVENVDVYKSLTISSENGSDTCIVQAANSDDHVFEVTADYVNITGFSITNSTVAISLDGVTHCNITDNNVSDNSRGIGLMFSDNNNIADNIVVSNSVGFLGSYSNNNTIEGNIVTNNYCGIYMVSSSNNFVYNNYFNNTDNALDFGGNIWDIPKTAGTNIIGGPYLGGNYWSDYAGEDLDGDGLGDTLLPYNSSGDIGGGDDRPLVIPEDPCEIYDTNGTPGIQKEEAVAAVSDYLIDHTIDKATAVAVLSCYYFG
ncbi:MAG: right-handed parallel beta-helix repeat-containing protein, partial [Candidatus Syntrophoarchaeum sp.]|nr:right-handed parallel beta-helix repeat-containing protein [Candidatus Syntrophoarchaeum sp.]